MKIQYENYNPHKKTSVIINQANEIIEDFQSQGYDLTLRQLYYQFVSRDLIENSQKSYSNLGNIISKARRAGLIDWDAITDRTRNLKSWGGYENSKDYITSIVYSYRKDLWMNSDYYIEVWFEKDALMGVFQRACSYYRLPFFSCRGYTSDSEIHSAAQRFIEKDNKYCYILHFGDHDPSGIDMTRDINDRFELFGANHVDVKRLALNMNQINSYNPPPNPAKETDSRFESYQKTYGDYSWELDALNPTILTKLVEDEVESLIDVEKFEELKALEDEEKLELREIGNRYDEIVKFLKR